MFDKLDKLFFDTILLNEKFFINAIGQTLNHKLNLTKNIMQLKTTKINVEYQGETKEHMIILFGTYHKLNGIWKWIGQSNELFANHLINYGLDDIFGSFHTFNKIFLPEFQINVKDQFAIPCLISIFNPAFNLVSFMSEDGLMFFYALVNLGIKDNFVFGKFISDMVNYKKIALMNKVPNGFMNRSNITKSKPKSKSNTKSKSNSKSNSKTKSKTKQMRQ
jgi:hypothetical protein